jgi:hypothetical protein
MLNFMGEDNGSLNHVSFLKVFANILEQLDILMLFVQLE